MDEDHLTDPIEQGPEEERFDRTLRPRRLDDYIGQRQVIENLRILIEAARLRQEPVEHVLLSGPPGLGKTTLAGIIANELEVQIRATSGPAIDHAGALGSLLTNLGDRDVLFIDEVHRLNTTVEEALYPALEDFKFDFVAGKGAGAMAMQLPLAHFTCIGATTRQGLLSGPMRDRFGAVYRLDFYDQEDLERIVVRSARLLEFEVDREAARELARRSRGTPRIANRLLRRVRDYADVRASGRGTLEVTRQALQMLEVDHRGLEPMDRRILGTIIHSFDGGPVGLDTVAVALAEEPETIEDVHEPFLIQIGFLARTPRGRVVTGLAYEHMGLTPPGTRSGGADPPGAASAGRNPTDQQEIPF
ncbi:MAG TPA: Holliday junction branch migration DNA helicase RuvB [Candidatus Dormibacteraeota bacterium]|nr:Holliday junction branch migration DNA helicase RuvB [Candidatus Dormibacteraeota bacterium]